METWIRYAERTAVDQSISYEGMQKFSEDQIGFTLFGTLPQDPSTASQLSNALTNVCKLLKQFDPDEIGSQQRLVGLQESMNETVKTLTSILSLL
jgi:hypothetical protein